MFIVTCFVFSRQAIEVVPNDITYHNNKTLGWAGHMDDPDTSEGIGRSKPMRK